MNQTYPFPIVENWRESGAYPKADDLTIEEWAWEFLRRNPEYQRHYDRFVTLPDNYTLEDGSTSNKNGKWKGTPWSEFRFFDDHTCYDNACFYADPPPIPGETRKEYERREKDGCIMPFAEFFWSHFNVMEPRDPRLSFWLPGTLDPEYFQGVIFDDYHEDTFPPYSVNMFTLMDWLSTTQNRDIGEIIRRYENDELFTLTFDVRKSIDRQLEIAKKMLLEHREIVERVEKEFPSLECPVKHSKPHYQPRFFPMYVCLLDAEASGASIPEMAEAVYPGEANSRSEGQRVSKKVIKSLRVAKEIRDGGYFKMLV